MKTGTGRVHSFFYEMIIVILFFSISVTVILQLFLAAGSRARQSRDLSTAVVKAQNIAEQVGGLSASDALPEALKDAKTTGNVQGGKQYQIQYDGQWRETKTAPRYVVNVTMTKTAVTSGVLVDADISVFRCNTGRQEQLFTLAPSKFFPEKSFTG